MYYDKINEKTIMQLHDAAGRAGDLLMAAICQMAVEGNVNSDTWDALSEHDRVKFNAKFFTHQLAHAECARVLTETQS